MSWKFLLSCLILLTIGVSGLELLDQRIVEVNQKLKSVELRVYIEHFENGFNDYIENLKVNFSLFKVFKPNQLNKKLLTEHYFNYIELYPSLESMYMLTNNSIEYSLFRNYQHNIKEFNSEQKAKINSGIQKTLREHSVTVSKPLNFFDNKTNYIIFFIPVQSEANNKVLMALFNLNTIIEQYISTVTKVENATVNIKTASGKLIYGPNIDKLSGDMIIEVFSTPLGEWKLTVLFKNPLQFQYLRRLIWILGFALMFFLVFYMLIIERKNNALIKNYDELKATEQKLKLQYQRELLLREIIQEIHSPKDISNLLNFICVKLGDFFHIDYLGFIDNKDVAEIKFEYLSSEIKQGFMEETIPKDSQIFDYLANQKQIFISNNIQNDKSAMAQEIAGKFRSLKAIIIFPVIHDQDVLAFLFFACVQPKQLLNNEEIEYIKAATSQIAIAMHQSDLICQLNLTSETIKESYYQELCMKNIVQTIRTSIDITEVAYYVNKELGKFLNLDKIAMIELDDDKKEVISLKGEYVSSEELVPFEANEKFMFQFNKMFKNLPTQYKTTQVAYSDSREFFIKVLNKPIEEVFSEEFFLKSFVITPIIYQHKLFGSLNIAQVKYYRNWKASELEFLAKVAEQLAIGMYQMKLYDELKKFTDKQVIITKIFEVIRSSIDIDEILWNACNEIGSFLKVDRCSIIEHSLNSYLSDPIKYEYLSNRDLTESIGLVANINPDHSYAFNCILNEKRPFMIDEVGEDSGIIRFINKENYIQEFNIKSILILPIIYGEDVLASIYLCQCFYVRRWTDSEVYFLNSITNQIAIAIYQARLFKELNLAHKKLLTSYQKEQTVRRILEVVRSSLDLTQIYKDITGEIGKVLAVNNCFFVEYDIENDKFLPINVEYRSGESTLSVTDHFSFDNVSKLELLSKIIKIGKKPFIVDDVENFYIDNEEIRQLKKLGAKSVILLPIAYQNKPLGLFVVTQTDYKRCWKSDEIEVLTIVADQVGIAISQVKMYEHVQEMSRLKSEFLASVSHELKTPLNSIIVLSEIMQKKDTIKSLEEQNELLQIIHSSGEELLMHINNILEMAKVESTKKDADYQFFSLQELIDEIILYTKPLADEQSIRLIVDIEKNLNDEIYSDRKLLKSTVNNLINNAIKFTDEGQVELKIQQVNKDYVKQLDLNIVNSNNSNNYLLISIKDTGIGIEKEFHKLIFDEFRQVENVEVRKYGGTGLGLAICKKSIAILGGTIWLDSTPGLGSEFKVLVPLTN